jgi:thioester reductase-like protein
MSDSAAETKRALVEQLLRQQASRTEQPCPLSYGQQAMWVLYQMAPDSAAYNVAFAWRIVSALDTEALRRAFATLVARHPALRTSYFVLDGRPVQQVLSHRELHFHVVDGTGWSDATLHTALSNEAHRPFDLEHGPLMRVTLFTRPGQEPVLLLNVHHIAVDGWSLNLLSEEVRALYAAEVRGQKAALPPVARQYTDYVRWQQKLLDGPRGTELWTYWQEQLGGDLPVLDLPLDRPRPPVQSYNGAAHSFSLDEGLTRELKALAEAEHATLYTVLLTAFTLLLHRYTGQDDLVVGSPTFGRTESEFENVVGYFVNPVALRADLRGNPTVRACLAQLRRTAVAAMDHQDFPFPLLVERLLPGRDASRSPLFQAVFALQQASRVNLERVAEATTGESHSAGVLAGDGGARISLGDLLLDTYPLEQRVARFDLELQMIEAGGVLSGNLQYNTDLLEPATVERMARHFRNLLIAMAADAAQTVANLPLLTAEELARASGTAHFTEPESVCVHALIADRAAAQPEAIAVTFGPHQLTYAELDRRAEHVAMSLRAAGVKPDQPVGLLLELSVDAIAGLLGILKAGAACLPLDPADPLAWTAQSLSRAGSDLVLTRHDLAERLPRTVRAVKMGENPTGEYGPATVAPQHLALVTDRAQIEHRHLVSRITWLQSAFSLTPADVLLQHTTLTQAKAVPNILWALAAGARLTLAQSHGTDDLPQFAATSGATVLPVSVADLRALARTHTPLPALRLVLSNGGAIPAKTAAAFGERFPHLLPPLLALPESAAEIVLAPAGLPQAPVAMHLHDRFGHPVPTGVPASVFISGPGSARARSGALLSTGLRARQLADGTVEPLDAGCWIDGVPIDTAAVEAVLLADPAVAACAVRSRETVSGETDLVAVVVPTGPFAPDRLRIHLQNRLPAAWRPAALIGVTALPYTRGGRPDEAALAHLPLVDEESARRCTEQVRTLPGVTEAVVIAQPLVEHEPNLHLSDMLPAEHTGAMQQAPTAPPSAPVVPESGHSPAEGRPAVADGGELHFPAGSPTTLPEALRRAAAASRTVDVTYLQADGTEVNQSYADLLKDAQRILGGLRHLGLQPGDRVLFQLEQNQDFIPSFWGCVLGGFVPVPLSIASSYEPSNAAAAKLTTAWSMLGSPLVLAGTALAPAIIELGKATGLEGMQVETPDVLRQYAPDLHEHPCTPDDVVLMPLTSGSTGMPKGVMLTHRNILSRQEGSRQLNGFSVDDISFNWMPLDHVGGIIYFHLRDVYLGARQVHAPTDAILQEPLLWLTYIQKYRASVTWAPNFAYALIADRAGEMPPGTWDLSSMRWFLNGGEACVAKTARRFLQVLTPQGLPATAMHPVFGMSETSSGMTYNNTFTLETSSDDDPFVDIGVPIPGDAIRVVDGAGQVVPEGAVGHLQVRGATVHTGYYKRPELNQEAFTADGWFTTGDKAMILGGHLVITGREKDIIIINGVNYYCHEIEAVAEEVEGVDVSFTAACGVRGANSSSDQLAIFFSPLRQDDASLLQIMKEIRSQVVRRMSINPTYLIPIPKETVPKTAIGKIQRAELRNRFHAGEYRELLKRLDILSGSPNTLPDWFFRPTWRQREAPAATGRVLGKGLSVVLLDNCGIGDRLLQALPNAVGVRPGVEFAEVAPGRYQLNPSDPGHYRMLLSQLDGPVERVIHLWTYGAPDRTMEEEHERGLYSSLGLVQALAAKHRGDDPVSLYVLTNHTQAVEPADTIACGRATLLGLLRTIPLELPWLQCRHVDLASDEDLVTLIQRELAKPGADAEVAYRNGRRLVRGLEKVRFDPAARVELPFRKGGMYLISGGLGGVGQTVARYLLRQYGARLLLADLVPNAAHSEGPLDLTQTGDQVQIATVDITNVAAVRKAVLAAEAAWQCQLDGIIHLAGRFHERSLVEENRESMAALLQPKVAGAIALNQLAQERPGVFFIAFSSVNGFFGGANVGAYAAANGFLDAFVSQQTQRGMRAHCVAWSMWDEVGMSRDYALKDLSRTRGYHAIGAEQGITSLLAVLHHDIRQGLVGLDGTNPYIRRYLAPEARPLASLSAFVATASELGPITGIDRYGEILPVLVTRVDRLPRTESGEVDVAELVSRGRRGGSAERIAPRTELERQIAGAWQKVLGIAQVSVDDSFFELGGNSLLATQLVFQLRKAIDVALPVQILFKTPTVAGMAQAVALARRGDDPSEAAGGFDAKHLSSEVALDPDIRPQGPVELNQEPKAVFITGASGFLGSYLLHELLRQTNATVFCLVRARDPEQGRMRLRGNLAEYGLWEEQLGARIIAVPGDLGQPRFGLTPEQFTTLADTVDAIYHNGALVNFTYPYAALKAPNVAGTQEVLRLAVTGHTKPVHYVSTVGVFSHFRGERGTRLPEIDAPEESEGLRLGYTQSKWVSEKMVELARRRGIPVSVYRPGRLSGDTITGACQTHDFMWMLIKGSIQLGLVPDDNVVIDMTPVDYVSRAIVSLSRQSDMLGQTFHMTNPHTLYLDRLVRALRSFGYPLKQVPYSEWRSVLLQLAADGHTDNAAYPFTPLLGPEIPDEMYLEFDCQNVLNGLTGSDIACMEVDEGLLDLYFRYFTKTGFLDAPESLVR